VALRGFDAYLGGFGSVGSQDFAGYWSAARLAMNGGNPYSPAALLAVERAAGWSRDDALMVWNPPWTWTLLMPIALVPFRVATFIWLLFQVGLLLVCGFFLWRYFAPESRRYSVGLLLAVAFVPGWFALSMGQISPWLLAGVVGYLWAERKGRDLVAGVALALITIKPHVTYLFFLAALWWIWRDGRWRIALGWLLALVGASGLVLLVNRDIFGSYLVAAANPPVDWAAPTLGTWLRLVFGAERRWLQYLPSLLGGLGLLAWLCLRQGPWRWAALAGPLLLASVTTAIYGWSFDQVVLMPAMVATVSHIRQSCRGKRTAIPALLAVSQLALLVQKSHRAGDEFSVWHSWALAGIYWWAMSGVRSRGEAA
jgi:hypothetical protein